MKSYEVHILYLYFVSFVKTLLFISSIVISIKTLNITQSLTEDSAIALNDIGLISTHITPHILYIITPFALAIAAFSVFYKLLTHSEIVALQNAGLSNFSIIRPHLILSVTCSIIMLYLSAMIIPKTVQIRKNVQKTIIQRKIENFLSPNTIKEVRDITIVTSQLDKSNNIALTLIHKPIKNGETVLIGNIRQSWEKNGMIGLITDNATILSIKNENERIMKFKTLETQINPFEEEEEEQDLRHLTTPEIISLYRANPDNKYIITINTRILPSLSAILLPFAITTLLVKFYKSRSRYTTRSIIIITLTILYILFSCYNMNETFSSLHTFGILYLNIILTFIIIYLQNGHRNRNNIHNQCRKSLSRFRIF